MQLYYLNDERKEIIVKVMDDTWDVSGDNGKHYYRMAPAEGRVFDISCPPGSVLYVKKWPELVMLTYIDPAVLAQLAQRPQESGKEK